MESDKIVRIAENIIGSFPMYINTNTIALFENLLPIGKEFHIHRPLKTFSGRKEELKLIHENLKQYKYCVISGFSGIGKTELAKYYAWTYLEYFDENVIWIDATDYYSMKKSFNIYAEKLGFPNPLNCLVGADNIIPQIYLYFQNKKCLFIFDDVSSTEALNYIPWNSPNENIYILITSHNMKNIKMINLQPLSQSEATDFVVLSLKPFLDTEKAKNDNAKLAKYMMNTPIALQQAASYIKNENTSSKFPFTVQNYNQMFEGLYRTSFSNSLITNGVKSLELSIILTIRKLSDINASLAEEILYLVAYFAPYRIDKNLFEPLAKTKHQKVINEAFTALVQYSLINEDTGLCKVHPQVQLIVRKHLKKIGAEKKILTKGLDLILVVSEKYSIHSSYLLKYAYEEKILFDYYKNCANKMLFWYDVVHMNSPEIALSMLPIITNPAYFNGQDIINGAMESKSIKLVQLLMERGASVNEPSYDATTPLSLAAAHGDLHMVKFLVTHGADLNYQNMYKHIPLTYAIEAGQVEIVKYLIDAGTNLFIPNSGLLHAAARYGRLDLIQILLDKGVDINTTKAIFRCFEIISENLNYVPETALDWAASYGHLNVVKFLLNRGARLETKVTVYEIIRRDHVDVLRYFIKTGIYNPADIPWQAIFQFKSTFDKKVVECFFKFCPFKEKVLAYIALQGWTDKLRFLVEKGVTLGEDWNGSTIFHVAIIRKDMEMLKGLASTDIDINQMDKCGKTALAYASESGGYDFVMELCKAGANPNIYQKLEDSPIYLAITHKHMNIVEYLIEAGANLTDRCLNGESLLAAAAQQGLLDLVLLLTEKGLPVCDTNNVGSTPLHEAAYNNHVYVVKLLLKNGAKVNQEDEQEYTALFHACDRGHFEVAEILIQHGSDVNHVSQSQKVTPLLLACRRGEPRIVSLLIEHGSDVNFLINFERNNAFYEAIKGHVEVLDILRKAGVDFHQKSNKEVTVLDGRQETNKHLSKNGMDTNEKYGKNHLYFKKTSQLNNIESMKPLLSLGGSIKNPSNQEMTPLQFAAYRGYTDMVKFLVNQGANLDSQDVDGNTALHQACYMNHLNIVSFLCYKGADVNKYNKAKSTPLHLAVEQRHLAVVNLLIESHADKYIKNDAGLTPEDLAKQMDLQDIVESNKMFIDIFMDSFDSNFVKFGPSG